MALPTWNLDTASTKKYQIPGTLPIGKRLEEPSWAVQELFSGKAPLLSAVNRKFQPSLSEQVSIYKYLMKRKLR